MGSIDIRPFHEHYVNTINNHDFDRMEAFYSRSIRFQLDDTFQNFDELVDGLNGSIAHFRTGIGRYLKCCSTANSLRHDTPIPVPTWARSRASGRPGGRCRPWS